ncbi:WAP-type 'four-disulfide core [Trichuris suis]|nr:WAP-type 'four-disulfide core [Trichuris suis]
MKCCITSVGYDCTSPVEESLRPSKRGICPWPSSVMEKGRLCSSDGDCQGSRKCCPTKAGNACVKPVSEELAGGRGTCPPAAYVMGLPGSCRRDKDCEDGKKCCDGVDGKSCSVLVLAS